ncbi:MAG: hypothetical protein DMF50_09425 [Acidobacteria bacterium]|nr:MAG: hypothetical protein DMF50_09425 [Acidobacteriota bacterium]
MSFARAARRAAALALLAAAPAIRCAGDGSEHAAPTAPEAPGAPALPARAASDPSLPIVLQDPQGRTIRLADFGGKVRLFDVWATWCGPCRMGIPKLNSLYARYRGRGLVVVGISVDDDPGYVVDFEREIPLRYDDQPRRRIALRRDVRHPGDLPGRSLRPGAQEVRRPGRRGDAREGDPAPPLRAPDLRAPQRSSQLLTWMR